MVVTMTLASASLPQIIIVPRSSPQSGSIIMPFPMVLKALTNLTSANSAWRASMSELYPSGLKKGTMPPGGGIGALSMMGFVASMTTFDASPAPQALRHAAAAVPLTARIRTSPNSAASAKVPAETPAPSPDTHSASLVGSRELSMAGYPCLWNPAASTFATSPEPRTPTLGFVAGLWEKISNSNDIRLLVWVLQGGGVGNAELFDSVRTS
mmetsp:Transcript_28428/g.83077  ORF Transcript_28428/g.83077 Transcript_28428/m.83077 type:complete len:211 (-) Transcript_28428:21-653(-)